MLDIVERKKILMLNEHLISCLTLYLHKNMIDLINNFILTTQTVSFFLSKPKQFLIITYLTNNSIWGHVSERESMCLEEKYFTLILRD